MAFTMKMEYLMEGQPEHFNAEILGMKVVSEKPFIYVFTYKNTVSLEKSYMIVDQNGDVLKIGERVLPAGVRCKIVVDVGLN